VRRRSTHRNGGRLKHPDPQVLTIALFFHDGPFAWNGLFTWYVPVVVFGIWIIALSILMLRAIAQEESEEATEPDPDGAQLASMAPAPERINA
ncbi:hypothetical protein ACJH6J_27450, partial [Mycobacterium sp. SMC-18]